jgi:hypothetical protein
MTGPHTWPNAERAISTLAIPACRRGEQGLVVTGLDSCGSSPYDVGMSRHLEVPKFAYDQALRYLARPGQYGLTDGVRNQLTQVVEGFAGRCEEDAARQGIEWMRLQDRIQGRTPRF